MSTLCNPVLECWGPFNEAMTHKRKRKMWIFSIERLQDAGCGKIRLYEYNWIREEDSPSLG
jgi:hypothetical protein